MRPRIINTNYSSGGVTNVKPQHQQSNITKSVLQTKERQGISSTQKLEIFGPDILLKTIKEGRSTNNELTYKDIETIRSTTKRRLTALYGNEDMLELAFGKAVFDELGSGIRRYKENINDYSQLEQKKIKNIQHRLRNQMMKYKIAPIYQSPREYRDLNIKTEIVQIIFSRYEKVVKRMNENFNREEFGLNVLLETLMREYMSYVFQKDGKSNVTSVLKTSATDDIMSGIDYIIVRSRGDNEKEFILADLAISADTNKEEEKRIKLQSSGTPYDLLVDIASKTDEKIFEQKKFQKTPLIIHPSIALGLYSFCMDYIENNENISSIPFEIFDEMLQRRSHIHELINVLHEKQQKFPQGNIIEKTEEKLVQVLTTI